MQQLLDAIGAPALAVGHRLDILAWNRPACGLFTDFARLPVRERNIARLHFLHDDFAARYPDREAVVRHAVGQLRLAAGRFPQDAELRQLVEEISARHADFRRHWAEHVVHVKAHGTKRINHPVAGALTLSYEVTHFPQDEDLKLTVFTAAPGSPGERALRRLSGVSSSSPA